MGEGTDESVPGGGSSLHLKLQGVKVGKIQLLMEQRECQFEWRMTE